MTSKSEIRDTIGRQMTDAGVARFPGAVGRIPNIAGAAEAQEQIAKIEVWKQARTIKCNPDFPQRPLRARALAEGKVLYMAVPRLKTAKCFLELDPERINNHHYASTIKVRAPLSWVGWKADLWSTNSYSELYFLCWNIGIRHTSTCLVANAQVVSSGGLKWTCLTDCSYLRSGSNCTHLDLVAKKLVAKKYPTFTKHFLGIDDGDRIISSTC